MKNLRVVIVGGGLGGLTMARALVLLGQQPIVLERAVNLDNLGGGLIIYPHADFALRAVGLEVKCRERGHQIDNYLVYENERLCLKGNLYETRKLAHGSLYSFSRHELQLLLRDSLPPETLRMESEVIDVHTDALQASVRLKNGTLIKADLVVLASGASSGLFQRTVLGKPLERSFRGQCFWGGFLTGKQCIDVPPNSMVTVLGQERAAFLLTLPNGKQWYYLMAKAESDQIDDDFQLRKLARKKFSAWCPLSERVLSNINTIQFGLPVYQVPFENQWFRQRIVGIGDAVHAVGPTAGQGANAAITDAVLLAQELACSKNLEMGLARFSEQRNKFINLIYEIEDKSSESKLTFDPAKSHQRSLKFSRQSVTELMSTVIEIAADHRQRMSDFQLRIKSA